MLGAGAAQEATPPAEAGYPGQRGAAVAKLESVANSPCEINPRSVVEAILFVGRPDNGSTSARELAAIMRGVSPDEIDSAVADGPQSLIREQVEMGVAVRMAVLEALAAHLPNY